MTDPALEQNDRYRRLQRRARRQGLSLKRYVRCSENDPPGGFTLTPAHTMQSFCEQERLSLDQVEKSLSGEEALA